MDVDINPLKAESSQSFLNLKVMGLEFRAKTKVLVHAAPEALHVALHCTVLDFYSHINVQHFILEVVNVSEVSL